VTFRFAAAYDALNPADHDFRYYAALARRLGARRVADLGCGTGVLATLLTAAGCEVVGIDPDADMLATARARPGTEGVSWIHGYADALPVDWADLVTMSGHVAQVFRTGDDWLCALRHVRTALEPGGHLAFEVRDPAAAGWCDWTRTRTLRTVRTTAGTFEFWHETTEVALPLVTYDTVTRDVASGETTRSSETLAFRDAAALDASLREAGLEPVSVHGTWDGGPVVPGQTAELIVTARRPVEAVPSTGAGRAGRTRRGVYAEH
jgi:ubiquinone/menaquinone biosynthesis C-methylase UbiE